MSADIDNYLTEQKKRDGCMIRNPPNPNPDGEIGDTFEELAAATKRGNEELARRGYSPHNVKDEGPAQAGSSLSVCSDSEFKEILRNNTEGVIELLKNPPDLSKIDNSISDSIEIGCKPYQSNQKSDASS